MKNSNKKGFTLVELVVVIAIIGVLAAILVPSMMGYVKKARMKTANGNAKTAYNACAEYAADMETLGTPVDWAKVAGEYPAKDKGAAGSIQEVIHDALASNGNEAGLVYVAGQKINSEDTFFVQWRKTASDDIFGQYPQAIKKVSQCGTKGGNYKTFQNV